MDGITGRMIPSGCPPSALQRRIRGEAGTKLRVAHARKIPCRRGLSHRRPQKVHANRAGRKAVSDRQYRIRKRISCPEEAGFAVVVQDGSFLMRDVVTGRKYRAPGGRRIRVPYTGSHKKITACGSLARDGRQFLRTYDRFSTPAFILYPRELQKHFGKVVMITDRAPPHRSKSLRRFLRRNKNIRIMYFPKGPPHLNAVEECWNQGKRMLLVSEYYRTFSDMRRAVPAYVTVNVVPRSTRIFSCRGLNPCPRLSGF